MEKLGTYLSCIIHVQAWRTEVRPRYARGTRKIHGVEAADKRLQLSAPIASAVLA